MIRNMVSIAILHCLCTDAISRHVLRLSAETDRGEADKDNCYPKILRKTLLLNSIFLKK